MDRITSYYFYGNEVSDYAKENGYVDYRTLSKSFDAVMNNSIMEELGAAGFYFESETPEYYFEDESGDILTESEKDNLLEELETELNNLDEETDAEKIEEINNRIETLEEYHYHDIFQYFIVDNKGADILKEAGEIVYYCEKLDMYVWGVTHWGTSWDYVLTNIKIDVKEN